MIFMSSSRACIHKMLENAYWKLVIALPVPDTKVVSAQEVPAEACSTINQGSPEVQVTKLNYFTKNF